MADNRRLPDYLRMGLKAVFVGINPGVRSAMVGHHFAGYSNRFWKLLVDAELVPQGVRFEDDWRLPEWGFGLTNLVARSTRGMHDLTAQDWQLGCRELIRKIRRYRPAVVALVGVAVYVALFPSARYRRPSSRSITGCRLGLRRETLAGVPVFVLPNPSGRNAHYTYSDMLKVYRELRRYLVEMERLGSGYSKAYRADA